MNRGFWDRVLVGRGHAAQVNFEQLGLRCKDSNEHLLCAHQWVKYLGYANNTYDGFWWLSQGAFYLED